MSGGKSYRNIWYGQAKIYLWGICERVRRERKFTFLPSIMFCVSLVQWCSLPKRVSSLTKIAGLYLFYVNNTILFGIPSLSKH